MKILLLGAAGQLGREIQTRSAAYGATLQTADLPALDITDAGAVSAAVEAAEPEAVINAAAYTAVDKAETERDLAFAVNGDGAAHIAAACKSAGCRLLHVSTDYVFGEGFSAPIDEEAPTDPLNVYGLSKLAGERSVRETLPDSSLIVRTSSLHGRYGANFVHTMLGLLRSRPEVSVVSDQVMSPTWACWLGEVLLELASKPQRTGIVHACSGAAISWFEFASAIAEDARPAAPMAKLLPIPPQHYPRPARRASYSAMSTARLTAWLEQPPLDWREGLRAHLAQITL